MVKRDCKNCVYGKPHKKDYGRCLKHWTMAGFEGGKYDFDPCRFTPKVKMEVKPILKSPPRQKKPKKPQTLAEIDKTINDIMKKRYNLLYKIDNIIFIKELFRAVRDWESGNTKGYTLTTKFRKFLGLSKKEAKLSYLHYRRKVNSDKVQEMTGEEWKKVSDVYNLILDKKEEFLIKERMEKLCTLAPCYADKGKTIRKEIALKICEGCGTENFLEAQYCRNCGKPQ